MPDRYSGEEERLREPETVLVEDYRRVVAERDANKASRSNYDLLQGRYRLLDIETKQLVAERDKAQALLASYAKEHPCHHAENHAFFAQRYETELEAAKKALRDIEDLAATKWADEPKNRRLIYSVARAALSEVQR